METAKTLAAIITLLIGFPVLVMTLLDKISSRVSRPAKSDAQREQELLRTEWPALAQHFGAPASDDLKAFYANNPLLARTELELPGQDPAETNYVAGFLPAHLDSLEHWDLSEQQFPIAVDGCGNCYAVHWTTGKVSFWDHEDGEEHEVAATLLRFLGA